MSIQTAVGYDYNVLGDGVSTTLSFDLKNVQFGGNLAPQLINPDAIYLASFMGMPTPTPNVTSLTISGTIVSVVWDSALTQYDPTTGLGNYSLSFGIGFNG